MKSREFKDLLDRYSSGKATPEEERLISDWYDNLAAHNDQTVDDELKQRLWAKIRPSSVRKNRRPVFLKIAASIATVVAAGLAFYFFYENEVSKSVALSGLTVETVEDMVVYVNNGKVRKDIQLPDGSKVTLETDSKISLKKNFEGEIRSVQLSGRAFFDVKRDTLKPFFVYSNEVTTRVLGTSFCVKAYDSEKEITVAVRTGKVSVFAVEENTAHGGRIQEVILTPNQRVVYTRGKRKVSKELVDNPSIILPKSTLFRMHYEAAPVTQLFDELAQNYGIDIEYDARTLGGCTLTTSLADEGFYERIEIICKAINAKYKIENAVVKIESRGCN